MASWLPSWFAMPPQAMKKAMEKKEEINKTLLDEILEHVDSGRVGSGVR